MADLVDYLIGGGDWAPQPWSSKTPELVFIYLSFFIKILHFITLFYLRELFWFIYAYFDILLV